MDRGMMLHHNPMVPHSAPAAGSPGPHRSQKAHHGFSKTHLLHKPFTPSTSPLAKEESSSCAGSPVMSRTGPNSPSINARGPPGGNSSPIVRTSPSGRGGKTWVTHPGSGAAQKPTTLYPELPSSRLDPAAGTTQRATSKEGSKTRKNKGKPVYLWASDDVTKWLRKHGHQLCTLYVDVFQANEITGRNLLRFTDWKLQRLGITNPAHREDLMRMIIKLKLKADIHDMKALDQKASPFLRK